MQNFTFILLVLYSLWSVTSVRLRRGSRAYFRIECCIGGESMAASRVNLFHTPPTNVEHEAGQAANTIFQAFCTTSLEIKPRLPAPVARAQPTVPHRLHETIVKSIQCQLYNSIYHIFWAVSVLSARTQVLQNQNFLHNKEGKKFSKILTGT